MTKAKYNKTSYIFTWIILAISIFGYLVFLSAALGKVGEEFSDFIYIAIKQLIILFGGLVVFFIVGNINYNHWRKYALPLFAMGLVTSLMVFIPELGLEAGGAKRWLNLGPVSFQPAELLKLGFVIYLSAWLASFYRKVGTLQYGLLPLLGMIAIASGILFLQPDTGTAVVITVTGIAMFVAGGGKWRHILSIALIGIIALALLASVRPYVKERFLTYLDYSNDLLGSSYQINQSLMAIGSGGITGRGFGQSVQKFSFLPQPIGDSIFSVAAEEFGFIGAGLIIVLFIIYTLWGLKIAARAPNNFGRLLAVGLVILVTAQSFINIGAMIGMTPLTGIPLVFFSQGGTALLFALLGSGIILNISRQT